MIVGTKKFHSISRRRQFNRLHWNYPRTCGFRQLFPFQMEDGRGVKNHCYGRESARSEYPRYQSMNQRKPGGTIFS